MKNDTVQHPNCVSSNLEPLSTSNSTGLMVSIFINICFSLTATLGNLLVISAIWRTPSLHNPSNVLLCCLAVTDLGVGLTAQPSYVVYEIAFLSNHKKVACMTRVTTDLSAWTLLAITFCTMTLISVEKYLALYLHLRYREFVTIRRVLKIFALVCLLSLLHTLFRAFLFSKIWYKDAHIYVVYAAGTLCLMATVFSYYKTFCIVRYHQVQISDQSHVRSAWQGQNQVELKKYRKSVATNLVVLLTFLFCFIPHLLVQLFWKTNYTVELRFEPVFNFSATLVFINSSLNPVLLYWRLRQIRKAMNDAAKKIAYVCIPFNLVLRSL